MKIAGISYHPRLGILYTPVDYLADLYILCNPGFFLQKILFRSFIILITCFLKQEQLKVSFCYSDQHCFHNKQPFRS